MNKNEIKPDLIQKMIKSEEKDYMQADVMERLRSRIREDLYKQSKSSSMTPKKRWLIPVGAFIFMAAAVILYLVMSPDSNLTINSNIVKSFLENNSNIQNILERNRVFIQKDKQDGSRDETGRISNFIFEAMISSSHRGSSFSTKPDTMPAKMKVTATDNLETIKFIIRENTIKNFLEKFTFIKEDNNDSKNISRSSIHRINRIQLASV